MGRKIEKEVITLPTYASIEEQSIPKERTGLWETVWNHVFRIIMSKRTNRFFVYDHQGVFMGELTEGNLFDLSIKCLSALNAFREEIHKSRKGNVWIVRILKNRKQVIQ